MNTILNANNENKETEDLDNVDGLNDIINTVRYKLIALIHSDISTINNPPLKETVKILKLLTDIFKASKDNTNDENLKEDEQPLLPTETKDGEN